MYAISGKMQWIIYIKQTWKKAAIQWKSSGSCLIFSIVLDSAPLFILFLSSVRCTPFTLFPCVRVCTVCFNGSFAISSTSIDNMTILNGKIFLPFLFYITHCVHKMVKSILNKLNVIWKTWNYWTKQCMTLF